MDTNEEAFKEHISTAQNTEPIEDGEDDDGIAAASDKEPEKNGTAAALVQAALLFLILGTAAVTGLVVVFFGVRVFLTDDQRLVPPTV